jgi:ubiquinone biosynthesis protein COQ9
MQQQHSEAQQQQQQQQLYLGSGLRVVPQQEWEGRLRQLLQQMPHAFVGGESLRGLRVDFLYLS